MITVLRTHFLPTFSAHPFSTHSPDYSCNPDQCISQPTMNKPIPPPSLHPASFYDCSFRSIPSPSHLFYVAYRRHLTTPQYPLPETYLRPASNPDYYVDLLAEIEAVSQRGWFASWLNSWKGWIRFT